MTQFDPDMVFVRHVSNFRVPREEVERWVGSSDDEGPIWAIEARHAIYEKLDLGYLDRYQVDGEIEVDL